MTDNFTDSGTCWTCTHTVDQHDLSGDVTVCTVSGCYCGRNPLEWVPVSTCEWCSAGVNIVWCRTAKGRAIPIEPEPNPAGNVEIIHNPAVGGVPLAIVHGSHPGMFDDWTPYMPHHATCDRKLVRPDPST